MRKYEEKKVTPKPHIERELVQVTCDICRLEQYDHLENNWAENAFSFKKTTIQIETGSMYPDGDGDMHTYFYEICPRCFADHIVKHLETLGAKPRAYGENIGKHDIHRSEIIEVPKAIEDIVKP